MTEVLERPCGCACGILSGPPTPEQHMQALKTLLQACQNNFELWVEQAQLRDPDIDLGEAVAQTHQRICVMLNAATIYADAQPDGTPTQCYNQYIACLNAGTSPSLCLAQYEACLGQG